MNAMPVIIGAILGLLAGALGDSVLLGLVGGLALGVLFGRARALDERFNRIEATLRQFGRLLDRESGRHTAEPEPEPMEPGTPVFRPGILEPQPEFPEFRPQPPNEEEPPAAAPARRAEPTAPWEGESEPTPAVLREPARVAAAPDPYRWLYERIRRWLTTGNMPVKVGVIVSFIGFSFLLKYAIDRELLVIPLEVRLLGVALAGVALIVIGWRLRERMRVYALSLQGGGAGLLFLTIFAALRIWQLLPPGLAFVLLVALTAFTCVLAVLQSAQTLAVLGVVGAFLAPVLTSTGAGSHVVLFSYYLVINLGILGVAWYRAWRPLNLLGFAFTFVISGLWGFKFFRPELFASTEPFLVLYFLFYQAIAILYALRQPPERIGVVDGTLVFGTPAIAFGLQYALVREFEYGLAVSAVVLALFYTLTAIWLRRRQQPYLKLLCESFIALGVAFATIAIPLALDARWTAAAWALEGAALIWIGVRQHRVLANLAGCVLVFLAGAAFAAYGWRSGSGLPVLNGNVLGGVLISLSSLFGARMLSRLAGNNPESEAPTRPPAPASTWRLASITLFAWGALWWMGTGLAETLDRADPWEVAPLYALFATFSALAASWFGANRLWKAMQFASLALLPLLWLLVAQAVGSNGHLLDGLGWIAWPSALLGQARILYTADRQGSTFSAPWHLFSLILLTAVAANEAGWWTEHFVFGAWGRAVAVSMVGTVALLVWRFRRAPPWPVPALPTTYLGASMALVMAQVLILTLLCVVDAGDSGPLPYLPLLNPYDLATAWTALLSWIAARLLRQDAFVPIRSVIGRFSLPLPVLAAVAFFAMTSASLVRGIHTYAGVSWHFDTLFDSVQVQTALSIYWGVLGFSAMILGARSARRPVWLAGAGLMALVVLKLFVVDLDNSGTIERIVSFIGVGSLLLIVGYFAPAPPRAGNPTESFDEEDRDGLQN